MPRANLARGLSWLSFSGQTDEELLRKFGRATLALVSTPELPLGRATIWGLDRKVFRAVAQMALPEGHSVVEVCSKRASERSIFAARAFERLRRNAAPWVPALPEEFGEGRCLVWSSWVVRPSELEPVAIEYVCVRRDEVPLAVSDLWSRFYLDSRLAQVSPEARKVEPSVALSGYHPDLEQWLERRSVTRVTPDVRPLPSLAEVDLPLGTVESDLLQQIERAFVSVLDIADPAEPWGDLLLREPGRLGLLPHSARLGERAHPSWRDAIELSLGAVPEPRHVRPFALKNVAVRLGKGTELLLLAREAEQMAAEVKQHAQATEANRAWLSELDLGILPDDGLCTTLLGLAQSWRAACALAARSELLAGRHLAAYGALTGLPLLAIDGGLKLPLHQALLDFEEAMTRVRADGPLVRALNIGLSWPDGLGSRALAHYLNLHGAIFGGRGTRSLRFEEAVRRALPEGTSVSSRLSRGVAEADRLVARFEEGRPRVVGALVAPLRAQARAVVSLREIARHSQVILSALLSEALADVDRRLVHFEPGLPPGSAYYATLDELIRILDLRGENLSARVFARQTEMQLSGQRLVEGAFVGLASRRSLGALLDLIYADAPPSYRGRATDSFPTLARSLSIALA